MAKIPFQRVTKVNNVETVDTVMLDEKLAGNYHLSVMGVRAAPKAAPLPDLGPAAVTAPKPKRGRKKKDVQPPQTEETNAD